MSVCLYVKEDTSLRLERHPFIILESRCKDNKPPETDKIHGGNDSQKWFIFYYVNID